MGRPRAGSQLTLKQLENMLDARRSELVTLQRERSKAMKVVDAIDAKIRQLGGSAEGSRARNPKSLIETLEALFVKAGKPLSVSDLVEGATASGYRSNSANFRGIINQTLIKERKRFANVSRGMYALKK